MGKVRHKFQLGVRIGSRARAKRLLVKQQGGRARKESASKGKEERKEDMKSAGGNSTVL